MIQLVLVSIIVAILGFLAIVMMRRKPAGSGPAAKIGPVELPTVELPSRALMSRILAEDDLGFIDGEGVRAIRKQFLQDRRRLALSWLLQTRRQATAILGFHLRAVRTDFSLRPSVELQLALHTLLFFATYAALWSLVTCYGAFGARAILRNVVNLSGRLAGLGGSILADAGRPRIAESYVRI
jgi:hypothetical protein